MESLIFVANGLYIASYFMNDILRLRLLTVTAASCLATYFYTLPEPLWTVIGWNTFFVGLNLFQIARELRTRRLTRRHPSRTNINAGTEAIG